MDLFRYPGFGPPGRYPEEILHQMPPGQDLVFFNITHWRYSGTATPRPIPAPTATATARLTGTTLSTNAGPTPP